jgi:Ca2+-binding EF-hand superfamily protein
MPSFRCLTISESGVEFDEFLKYCEAKERVLRRVFDTIDYDKDGNLNRGELRVALDRLGISATDEEVRAAGNEETSPAPLSPLACVSRLAPLPPRL